MSFFNESQVNILDAIDSALLVEEARSKEEYERNHSSDAPKFFYPSSIGNCSRAIAMDMLGYPQEEVDPKFIRIVQNGNAVHTRYEDYLRSTGLLVGVEIPIRDRVLRISGRIDAVIRLPLDNGAGKLAVVEFKSSNERRYKEAVANDRPDDAYVKQVQLYMHMLGIDLACIILENKNTQDMWEYWVEYDESEAMWCIDKISMIISCVDAGILPEREFEKTSTSCRYCNFREECWNM